MDKLKKLLEEMNELLLIAGVPKYQIAIRYSKPKTDTLLNAFDWLHDLFISPEFTQLKYVWDLLPEERWAAYELFDIIELREQVMLEKAKKAVLHKWKMQRPRLFGRKNVIHQKNKINTT